MFYRQLDSRLRLALVTPTLAAETFALIDANRARLRQWLPWLDDTTTVEEVQANATRSLAELAAGTGVHTAIQLDGSTTGRASLNAIDVAAGSCRIGYWIAAAYEGQGLVTRAVQELIRLAQAELGLRRIVICAATGNQRSQAIPRRLGFVHARIIPQAENLYGHMVDHAEWTLDITTPPEPEP